jgi:uncharacterized protein GlcG (DUF336 family)
MLCISQLRARVAGRRWAAALITAVSAALLSSCDTGGTSAEPGAAPTPSAGCAGFCVETQHLGDPDNVRLTSADVEAIIAQGVAEAAAWSMPTTLAVVDRVGNVLAVWRTGADAPRRVLIASAPDGSGGSAIFGGVEGIDGRTDALAAIAKALTGAYLSSEGNAFSTRTASQIVQEHFNPGESFQPGGPLFGVQISQLACSDLVRAFDNVGPGPGPQRSPLGLSADPGGFPLYKNGALVGGVGAISDDLYSLDLDPADNDIRSATGNLDELVALAASFGFAAPGDRRADRITVEGKTLRFSDARVEDLRSDPQAAVYPPADGQLTAVPGYSAAAIQPGLVFGQAESGIRAAHAANADESAYVADEGFVLVDGLDTNRYPVSNGAAPAGSALLASEVETLLVQGLKVARRARAQIRLPLQSAAQVTLAVVDSDGNVLGMVRSRDAPVFGIDVALQKARSAALFSSADAAALLATDGIDTRYISLPGGVLTSIATVDIETYVGALRDFLDLPAALADGEIAFSSRALGNLARPFFPDGIDAAGPGPSSKPPGEWSVFSTGVQLDLVLNGLIQHVLFTAGAPVADVSPGCGGIVHNPTGTFSVSPLASNLVANGIQIFPGGVPIYRGDTLVGAIGVSGDGVEQDDMIAFLAVHQAGQLLAGALQNAPLALRTDRFTPQDIRLRYVQCPQAPFLDSAEQQPCEGK